MKPNKAQREATAARENRIEGMMAVAAFSAMVAYFIGRKGATMSLGDGIYYGLVIAAFFAVLYLAVAAIVIASRVVWRFSKGAWAYGASRRDSNQSETAAVVLSVLAAEVETIRASLDELLRSVRVDGGRVEEMHAAFKAAQAERQRR